MIKPRVLCVDDEPAVLEGLALTLRKGFDVTLAPSGIAALEMLDKRFAVIVSDMRMPGMDGAQFLSKAREASPDSVRILLTGHADLTSAVAAVNDGQIFRFLTKPCPPPTLISVLQSAAEQHRLITSERVLLEETLLGSVKAFTGVLALSDPTAFGRAQRLEQMVTAVAELLHLPDRWQLRIAALMSQLQHSEILIGAIPRLEGVKKALTEPVLQAVTALDALESEGHDAPTALGMLGARGVEPRILEALTEARRVEAAAPVRELALLELRAGMVLADDIKTKSGQLVVARGFEITLSFLERARNFDLGARFLVRA